LAKLVSVEWGFYCHPNQNGYYGQLDHDTLLDLRLFLNPGDKNVAVNRTNDRPAWTAYNAYKTVSTPITATLTDQDLPNMYMRIAIVAVGSNTWTEFDLHMRIHLDDGTMFRRKKDNSWLGGGNVYNTWDLTRSMDPDNWWGPFTTVRRIGARRKRPK